MSDRAQIDVRIPLSPTPSFFNRLWWIMRALDDFYDCDFGVYYTGDPKALDLCSFRNDPSILWHHIPDSTTALWSQTNNKFAGGICERFRPPFHADHVLMLDADVICNGPFNELFGNPALSAVTAHVGPFGLSNASVWDSLFHEFGVEPLPAKFELTGFPFMTSTRYTPAYFNTGVVFGPAKVFETLADSFFRAVEFLRATTNSYFVDQIALTLALAAHPEVVINELDLRYNFPNDPGFDTKYTHELQNIKFLHFLRQGAIDREKDFETPEATQRLIGRKDLQGSNEIFRQRIQQLTQETSAQASDGVSVRKQ